MHSIPSHIVLGLALTVLFTGCSSVSVTESQFPPPPSKLVTPPQIFITPFTFAPSSLRVDREGESLRTFENGVSNQMADRLAQRLTKHIAPASVLAVGGQNPATDSWIVEGEFTRINQGSRALRSIIGFGAGGTKMESTTKVFRVGPSKKREFIALIKTSGGSNAEPGALVGGVFGAGPRGILRAATSGVSADSRRTARTITATLSERLAADGALLPAPALRPKRQREAPPAQTTD
ncbi:MAG: DUF4410 domain-containing protein [Terrimicrobiaceae bacterium]